MTKKLEKTDGHSASFDKLATVTIQGGGVYGVSLLGQLSAVLEEGYLPTAYVGTSAGALISGLAWAGYSPAEILLEIQNLLRRRRLNGVLSSNSVRGGDDELSRIRSNSAALLSLISIPNTKATTFRGKIWSQFGKLARNVTRISLAMAVARDATVLAERGFYHGDGLEGWYNQLLKAKINPLREKVGLPKISDESLVTFQDFFEVDVHPENEILRPVLLLGVANLSRKDFLMINSHSSAFSGLSIAKSVRASVSFPVFFKPVELKFWRDTRTGKVADSTTYHAGAAAKTLETFVDGGVVSNFPAWNTIEQVRELLWGGAARRFFYRLRTDEKFGDSTSRGSGERMRPNRAQAFRPMIHIGLQVSAEAAVSDSERRTGTVSEKTSPRQRVIEDYDEAGWKDLRNPKKFWIELFDFVTSSGRTRLEDVLLEDRVRTRRARLQLIRQPVTQTGWSGHAMDLDKLNVKLSSKMYDVGYAAAKPLLRTMNFKVRDTQLLDRVLKETSEELGALLLSEQIGPEDSYAADGNKYLFPECSVFLLRNVEDGGGLLREQFRYCPFGIQTRRQDLELGDFEDTAESPEVHCYQERSPILSRADFWWHPTAFANRNNTKSLSGDPPPILEPRVCIPILDPAESYGNELSGFDREILERQPVLTEEAGKGSLRRLKNKHYGVLFGILSVTWPVPEPMIARKVWEKITDDGLMELESILLRASQNLGMILGDEFGSIDETVKSFPNDGDE